MDLNRFVRIFSYSFENTWKSLIVFLNLKYDCFLSRSSKITSTHAIIHYFGVASIYPWLLQEQKAKLLQFVTGTSGVPVQGFGYLQGNDNNIRRFTIHGDKNVKVFPRAHTCFNRIDMPIYKTKAEMQKYLTMAISMESTGFDIE